MSTYKIKWWWTSVIMLFFGLFLCLVPLQFVSNIIRYVCGIFLIINNGYILITNCQKISKWQVIDNFVLITTGALVIVFDYPLIMGLIIITYLALSFHTKNEKQNKGLVLKYWLPNAIAGLALVSLSLGIVTLIFKWLIGIIAIVYGIWMLKTNFGKNEKAF